MINAKEAKKFIDAVIIKELTRVNSVLTIADLGLKARQTDVAKVKELIRVRINKIAEANTKKKEGDVSEVPSKDLPDPA